jgi:hypothetical protein
MPNNTKGCIDYVSHPQYVGSAGSPCSLLASSLCSFIARLADAPTIYQSYKLSLLFPSGGRSTDLYVPNRAYLTPSYPMDPDASGGWRFAQCFGDKGDVEDITEGIYTSSLCLFWALRTSPPASLRPRPLRDSCSIVPVVSLTHLKSGQPISFPPSNLILLETTSQRAIRAVV